MAHILTLDVETSPIEGYVWSAWQQNVGPDRILTPTKILSYATKWLGSKAVTYRTYLDEDFLEVLHTQLNNADITLGYNHESFDHRHINREFLLAGLPPTRPLPMIDMLKVVKQRFHFPHNSLLYVASKVLGETKLETGGFGLWPAFMAGDPKAMRIMRKYNIQDTRLTEKLYLKLRPWVRNHPYTQPITANFTDEVSNYSCPACGSLHIELLRPRRTRCFAIRVVSCKTCGHFHDGARKKLL